MALWGMYALGLKACDQSISMYGDICAVYHDRIVLMLKRIRNDFVHCEDVQV